MYGQVARVKLPFPYPQVLVVGAVGLGGSGVVRGGGGGIGGGFHRDARHSFVDPLAPVVDPRACGGGLFPGGEGDGLGTGLGCYSSGSGFCGLWFGRGGGSGLAVVPAATTVTAASPGIGFGRPGERL
jgi:hypothetical protein